jgi:nucleoside-diphosphate-sugar epimerase
MKPVLLTGATGFIGQRLQKAFLTDARELSALVRPASSHQKCLLPGVNRIMVDLSDLDQLIPAISQASAVIYCAGSVRGKHLDDFRAANISGVRSMVAAMNLAGGKEVPLLLISSLAATRPHISDYANSKHLGEQELVKNARFPWSIFRPPAVYGPGDTEMLPILKLARKGLVAPPGPSGQRLSLIHVDDVAAAVLAWLGSWADCTGQIFTLDDGHSGGYSWEEIAQAARAGKYRMINVPAWLLKAAAGVNLSMSRLLRYSPMLTPGKVRELTQTDWVCNTTALSAASGWLPAIGLKPGIESLFEASKNKNI